MGGVEGSPGAAALSVTQVLSKKCHGNPRLMFARNMPWAAGRREEEEQEATSRSLGATSTLIRSHLQIALGLSHAQYFTPTCT